MRIVKIIKAFVSVMYVEKAFKYSLQNDYDKALLYIEKSRQASRVETYSELLLKGMFLCEKGFWFEAINVSKKAKVKIEKTKRLNKDERKYLTAFANDTINLSVVRGRLGCDLLPVDMNYDLSCVDRRHKRRFVVPPR